MIRINKLAIVFSLPLALTVATLSAQPAASTLTDTFLGIVFGHVTDGTVVWDSTGKLREVSVMLTVKGGTRAFAGVSGTGVFIGTLDRRPLDLRRLPKLDGTLEPTF